MSKKYRRKVYTALVDGAYRGLEGQELYDFIRTRCPKTTSKRLVRAAVLALSDKNVRDRHTLETILALAIRHRLGDVPDPDRPDDAHRAAQQGHVHESAPGAAVLDPDSKDAALREWKEQDDYLQEALEETMPGSDPISPGHVFKTAPRGDASN